MVKFKGNSVGTHVLVKELVVSLVAHELEYSHRRGNIVEVGRTFIVGQPALNSFEPGLQFGSPDLGNAFPFDAAHLPNLKNKEDLAQVLVLDTLFCNPDRHTGNILLVYEDEQQNKECKFYIVDHSHVLGHGTWSETEIRGFLSDTNLYVREIGFNYVPRNMGAFEPSLAKLEALDEQIVRQIVAAVPEEWGMTTAESNALVELIDVRKGKVRTIIETGLSS